MEEIAILTMWTVW